jgi:hypothetical protein
MRFGMALEEGLQPICGFSRPNQLYEQGFGKGLFDHPNVDRQLNRRLSAAKKAGMHSMRMSAGWVSFLPIKQLSYRPFEDSQIIVDFDLQPTTSNTYPFIDRFVGCAFTSIT